MNRFTVATLLFCFALAPASLAANDSSPSRCDDRASRQFDFWLGNWEVTGPDGLPLGRTRVALRHDGCVVAEDWTGTDGASGSALSRYDSANGHWHQTWVDSHGTLLLLRGGMEGSSMIMRGFVRGQGGHPDTLHHVTWTANDDGTVDQLWQVSTDHGYNWTMLMNGSSRRVGPAP
ncbi:MAG: hypothetical protein R3233_02480 [Xanthomonadales bacterium]|nr:hypothetical protein [Xanthomonadales bacterium]